PYVTLGRWPNVLPSNDLSVVFCRGRHNAAARVHHTGGWGGGVAAHGARAAGEHRQSWFALAWSWSPCFTPYGIVSRGASAVGLCRGSERYDRAPLHPGWARTTG